MELKEGSLTNFKDQLVAIQESDAYLFDATEPSEPAKPSDGIQIRTPGNPGSNNSSKQDPIAQALGIKE